MLYSVAVQRHVRLHEDLLNSTLWLDWRMRDIWLTAILKAIPWTAALPVEQLEVCSFKPTGWFVPPGRYGFANVGGPYLICHGLGIRREDAEAMREGEDALKRLCSPDKYSDFLKYEGRRLARVEGGYVILDYVEHARGGLTNAERCLRYRNKIRNKEIDELIRCKDEEPQVVR